MRSPGDASASMETSPSLSGAHNAPSQIPSSRAIFSWMLFTDEWAFLFDQERGLCARPCGGTPPINPTYLHPQQTIWPAGAAGERGFVRSCLSQQEPPRFSDSWPRLLSFSPGRLWGYNLLSPEERWQGKSSSDLILPNLLDGISLFKDPQKKQRSDLSWILLGMFSGF